MPAPGGAGGAAAETTAAAKRDSVSCVHAVPAASSAATGGAEVLATSCVSSQVGLPNPVLCPATCGRRECMHVLTGQKKLPHRQVCSMHCCSTRVCGAVRSWAGSGQLTSNRSFTARVRPAKGPSRAPCRRNCEMKALLGSAQQHTGFSQSCCATGAFDSQALPSVAVLSPALSLVLSPAPAEAMARAAAGLERRLSCTVSVFGAAKRLLLCCFSWTREARIWCSSRAQS